MHKDGKKFLVCLYLSIELKLLSSADTERK